MLTYGRTTRVKSMIPVATVNVGRGGGQVDQLNMNHQ